MGNIIDINLYKAISDLTEQIEYMHEYMHFHMINEFRYSCFKFKFKIKEYENKKKFCSFLKSKLSENLMPWDVCNYFISNNIKYRISFIICKEIGIRNNLILLKTVLYLKKEMLKLSLKKKYRLNLTLNKKKINGKIRPYFMFSILNVKRNKLFFIQADTNFWAKPKVLKVDNNKFKAVSFGWLFSQLGICDYNVG